MKIKTALFITIVSAFLISAGIDLANLENYGAQPRPLYIQKDNSGLNPVSDKGATLGRVLFYDKKLSANNTVACASCHKQQFAFGDTAKLSKGFMGGLTGRHAMRLVNTRFAQETKFFWDERANSLEFQTTQPIRNATEMGYSGLNGDPDFNALQIKLSQTSYYGSLFSFVYGDPTITEDRIQKALAQFIRSIQSFDSKFDIGRTQTPNQNAPFPNYSAQENEGKTLFLNAPIQGGAGCQGCHRAPEFDIDPNSKNNGIATSALTGALDVTNTRAPSLRDLFNKNGVLNGPMMHNGKLATIDLVINHYNKVPFVPGNNNLDPRLAGPAGNLNLLQSQKDALIAFLKTLSGTNIYTDPKWSDPFDQNGNLTGTFVGIENYQAPEFSLYPNPAHEELQLNIRDGNYAVKITDITGRQMSSFDVNVSQTLDLSAFGSGLLLVEITDRATGLSTIKKIIRE